MAKLQKRIPASMNAQNASFQQPRDRPLNLATGSNTWNIWHPSSCPSTSVSRTMSYAYEGSDAQRKYDYDRKKIYTNTTQIMQRPATSAMAVNSVGQNQNLAYVNYQTLTQKGYSQEAVPAPRTDVERYWAYRAIVAETKLAERMGLRTDELERMKEEIRSQVRIDATQKYHEERVLRLEKLALGLISTIVLISLIILFRNPAAAVETKSKRAFRPHLTIPILSPFTSIIEHEDSKFSFRTTAVFLCVLGVLAYAMFRYWLRQRPR